MPIPYVRGSGRRPHTWCIRADGWRDFFLSKGWTMRGAYSEKHIRHRLVVVKILEEHDDYYLCRFQLKDDLWADATAAFREREAEQRRGAFRVVQGAAGEATASAATATEWAEDDEAVGIGLTFASPADVERAWSNHADYLDGDGKVLADRILQREATGLLLDRDRLERLAQQAEGWLERLRSAIPDTEHLHSAADYESGVLVAELYPEDAGTFLEQAYKNRNGDPRCRDPKFNALADRLGLWRVDFHGEATLQFRFREYFSVTHAIAALEELPGVAFAEATPEYTDDQPDIAVAPAGVGECALVVRGAYNERTFTTTSRRYRFFLVSEMGVTQLSSEEASRSSSFRDAVADRPWRRRLRWPARHGRGEVK